jgi:hypothetical protein
MGLKVKLYPSSAGNIWISGYIHHRLKRGHPGHKILNGTWLEY